VSDRTSAFAGVEWAVVGQRSFWRTARRLLESPNHRQALLVSRGDFSAVLVGYFFGLASVTIRGIGPLPRALSAAANSHQLDRARGFGNQLDGENSQNGRRYRRYIDRVKESAEEQSRAVSARFACWPRAIDEKDTLDGRGHLGARGEVSTLIWARAGPPSGRLWQHTANFGALHDRGKIALEDRVLRSRRVYDCRDLTSDVKAGHNWEGREHHASVSQQEHADGQRAAMNMGRAVAYPTACRVRKFR